MNPGDENRPQPIDRKVVERLASVVALERDDLLEVGRFLRRRSPARPQESLARALGTLAAQDPGAVLLSAFDAVRADFAAAWKDVEAARGARLEPHLVASVILLREDLECLRTLAIHLGRAAGSQPTPALDATWHRMTATVSTADAAARPLVDCLRDSLDAAPELPRALREVFHLSPGDWWLALADPLLFDARKNGRVGGAGALVPAPMGVGSHPDVAPLRLAAAGDKPGPVVWLRFEGERRQILVSRDRQGALWAEPSFELEGPLLLSWIDADGQVHDEQFVENPEVEGSWRCRVDRALLEERLEYAGLRQGDATWLFLGTRAV